MILYEFEGKKLLSEAGIKIPPGQVLDSPDTGINIDLPIVLKAQVLSGKRADSGGIIKVESEKLKVKNLLEELFGKIINKEKVEKVLVEELIDVEREYYLSISYDTDTRGPILTISEQGGTGVEGREVKTFVIDPLDPFSVIPSVVKGSQNLELSDSSPRTEWYMAQNDDSTTFLEKLINLFFAADCLLLEINPLVRTKKGDWIALDAKIKLDDDAKIRHEEWEFEVRGVPGHTPTKNEIEAKRIDQGDYRGVAGSTYFDLDGDIAILSSGGGISLTGMDALIAAGGKPANFTEYSGNPPKEKVIKLAKIVLSKPNIHGLWVVGTVAANFTDIYETLSGLLEGLREVERQNDTNFNFPIVIRRGGPREEEAFEMLRNIKDLNLHLQGPEVSVAQSAQVMAKLAKEFKERGRE